MSRLLRLILAALVTLGLSFAGLAGPSASAAPRILFAFGDSVAAGEGSGPASGYDDNRGSFNEILAKRLGYQVHNFAVTGATTLDVLSGQVPEAVAVAAGAGVAPTLITVMVGANDISYGDCLLSVVGAGSANPCSAGNLAASLPLLAQNLGSALGAIRAAFPAARVVVVGYYNPLPKPVKKLGQLCPVMKTLYHASLLDPADPLASAFITQALNPDLAAVRTFQAQTHANARDVVGALNQTIGGVAGAVGAAFVPLDFTNHDFCADYATKSPAWVLAPRVETSGAIPGPGSASFSLASLAQPRNLCTDGVLCSTAPLQLIPPNGLGYQVTVAVNDFPHLTVRGNRAVADRIEHTLAA